MLWTPLAGALLMWLPGRWVPHPLADRFRDYLTIATSAMSLAFVLGVAASVRHPLKFRVGPVEFYLDALSILFVLLVSVVTLAASFYVRPCLGEADGRTVERRSYRRRTLFYSLFNLFHFTMVLVPVVSNLVVLWIGIELTTVTSTVLVAAERGRDQFEAAWKYIVITSTGIIFALLGTLFLASAMPVGIRPTMDWPHLAAIGGGWERGLVQLSFLFVLVGYGTKAGLAPMHTWLPDAHGQAPYPVSALLSGVLLKSALYAILRFYVVTNTALADGGRFTSRVLVGSGLLSLVVAIPLILKRNPLKRVLAYHSLEHMGIITFGLGIGGPVAVFGALLHVLNHGVTKSLMFLGYGNVQDLYPAAATGGRDEVPIGERARGGVLRAMPWTGTLLALGGFALVGSPPFSIFLSEFLILWGAVGRLRSQPSTWLIVDIVVFISSVTMIFAGLVRHLGHLLLGHRPERAQPETPRRVLPLLALFAGVALLGVTVPDLSVLPLHRLLTDGVQVVCGQGGCR
jgi:hydrogenase-4 component F